MEKPKLQKLISWNVNGLRACLKKGFLNFFLEESADAFCLQEIKLSEGQLQLELPGYEQYYNYAVRRGYSGTALFTKRKPESVYYGIGIPEHDQEGRVITAEFPEYYLVTVYTPNVKRELTRLDYRMTWEDMFRKYLDSLKQKKHVVVCGDMNVAHREIDLKNPKGNVGNAGFTKEERGKFQELLDNGWIDSFRCLYPQREEAYTWWSYLNRARDRNVGWRIDYFLLSQELKENLREAMIYRNIFGSDHCPVGVEIEFHQNE